MNRSLKGLWASALLSLAACGGGGDSVDATATPAPGTGTEAPPPAVDPGAGPGTGVGAPPPAADPGYDLNAAHRAQVLSGDDYVELRFESGSPDCTEGELSLQTRAAQQTAAGYRVDIVLTYGVGPCTYGHSRALLFDPAFLYRGTEHARGQYALRLDGPATPLPASVRVGDTGTYAKTLLIPTGSQAPVTEHRTTWVIEADTATSAIVNFKEAVHLPGAGLRESFQYRYRIGSSGPLVLQSIEHHDHTKGHHTLHVRN
ncbi:hypothetical protein [Rhizobacter sp. LjRoot28]|uniref:hypothetical protein n=1 Tax=Rhizobacter sp. LjRoot28 TaxID=3342309 RepID=UPI003ED019A3